MPYFYLAKYINCQDKIGDGDFMAFVVGKIVKIENTRTPGSNTGGNITMTIAEHSGIFKTPGVISIEMDIQATSDFIAAVSGHLKSFHELNGKNIEIKILGLP